SNGVAYVLDEAETFTARCNADMVQIRGLEVSDERLVLGLLGEHVGATGSVRGRAILDSWARYRDSFHTLVPYTAPVGPAPSAAVRSATPCTRSGTVAGAVVVPPFLPSTITVNPSSSNGGR